MPFKYSDLPDLSGKTFVIVGATSGVGKAQAQRLAEHGAHVIVVGRSEQKLDDAVRSIKADTNNDRVEGMRADLTDLKSVAAFCEAFLALQIPLYSLTLNAATVPDTRQMTANGLETQWQTNVLGQYLICRRLLPALRASPAEARIVIVSSIGHAAVRARFPLTDDYINATPYWPLKRYSETKLANVLLTRFLAKELESANVFVNCLHPGIVATDIWRNQLFPVRWIAAWFFSSSDTGAKTQTYLSASPDVAEKGYRGQYFVPDAKLSQASALAMDDAYAKELIDFLELQMRNALNE